MFSEKKKKTSIISGSIIFKNYTKSDHELTNRDNTTGIVVTERITWENGEYTRIPRLYIYVPVNMPEKNF